ncbi:Helicase superfamily 1 UvrD-related protein [Desulfovibrio sp. X2]|uniref:ATP-dependent helicase n=1 Tax=Desulfovibrio sp. X2 TaxID=941449 RepID=UPI0003588507|nr:ATP-dependent helicase [Desulfovibrio sp. X2]EPR39827.1 Helicase superfamily 1 UvrD-related protein [Desulfovibrio sp. X2]
MSIDYQNDLNEAQYRAVMHGGGPLLVIAGAGSGKTRTIVYRLARLVEQGTLPDHILLLTFTRKASQEMLARAGYLLGMGLSQAAGGTFHSFAFAQLRRYANFAGFENGFTIMDRADAAALAKEARERLALGKGDKAFPKRETCLELISKARNKELTIEQVVTAEYFHLTAYAEDLARIGDEYQAIKRRHGMLDYDDLLFELEKLLVSEEHVRVSVNARYRHVMVDEYQDTNLVQARLVKLLAGEERSVCAVGDDAQSIYAFRGANVANILDFPKTFPGAEIVRLEQNYRSTQPILDLTNAILANAREKYEKHLFTARTEGARPEIVRTLSDASQARAVMEKLAELRRDYALHEIAVLFRAGYQSYPVELELNKLGLPFAKYGGIRFTEAAHVKDVLAFLRLAVNPSDLAAWRRVLELVKGVGAKTALSIAQAAITGDVATLEKHKRKKPLLADILNLADSLRADRPSPERALTRVMEFYVPIMVENYPDDYPRRQQGLDELAGLSAPYRDMEGFLADISLENPGEDEREAREDTLVLSTIHSAKGLEWKAVMVIDLVEDRFPSRRAMGRPEDLEEERRLMYVACTRAKDRLVLFVPETIYIRHLERHEPMRPSPFILELPAETYTDMREGFGGRISPVRHGAAPTPADAPRTVARNGAPSFGGNGNGTTPPPKAFGFCTHKIYGRGKIIEHIPPDKYRVNFQQFGLKVIVGQYLEMEEA